MMEQDNLHRPQTKPCHARWQAALIAGALALTGTVQAQVLLSEDFTGGASTTGFTIDATGSDCAWLYAPGSLVPNNFNQDFGGALPSGAGFDSDFVFLDSDECGASGITVNSFLISPDFDASAPGDYILTFSQQFYARLESFAKVEVFNGTTWNQVAYYTGTSVGYPNPAVSTSINITTATAGSPMAQVRFQYSSSWDWWWALDNIVVEHVNCAAPEALAVTDITTEGGTINWTDNGSAGYEWAVTTGAVPDGTNELASGDTPGQTFDGLLSGTPYTAFVRSDCGDGTFSNWSSGFPFLTGISNDECSGAIALTVNPDYGCATVTAGTVSGATDSGVTSTCGGTADDDAWFSFTATDTAHSVSLIDITGSTSDMYMALWTGDCGNLTLVPNSCSDPENMLVGGLTIGTTYYLQVYTWTDDPAQTSAFNVCIGTPPPPPANDECSGAIALTVNPDIECGTVTAGTIASATDSGVTSTCGGTADDDVWFSFTATDTAHIVSLIDITGSTSDMYMALWTGDCGNLTLVPNSCSDPENMLVNGLTIGTTYYLQVYTYTSTAGQTSSFNVCVGTPPPPPANDECSGAIALTVNPNYNCAATTAGTIASATPSNVTSTCFGTADDDVWFSFVATDTLHRISLNDITGSTSDMYMALWTGDCGNLEQVPNSCSDPETMDVGGLAIGTTYYLQVYTWTSTPGQTSSFNVCVGKDATTGIDEAIGGGGMSVYPNPASTELFINSPNGKPAHVQVYDMVGHLAMETAITNRLDISALAPGSYTVVITDEMGARQAHARFMKQ